MINSAHGWMCLQCGHLESGQPAKKLPVAAQPVTIAQDAPASAKPVETVPAMPVRPAAKKRGRKGAVIVGLLLLLLLAGGAFAYQTIVLAPQQAFPRYLGKISSAGSGQFMGNLVFSSEQANLRGYKSNLNLSGRYYLKDKDNPKMAVRVDGQVGPSQLKGEIMAADKALYFRIDALGLLDGASMKTDKDWYRLNLEKSRANNDCDLANNPAMRELVEKLPIKNPKLVNLFDKVDGKTTAHYSGSLDMDKLPAVVAEANKNLSADCQLELEAKDMEGVTFDYELWTSHNFDRLSVVMNLERYQAKVHLTYDTYDYDRPVEITIPANARDLSEVLKAYSGQPTPPPPPPAATQPPAVRRR